MDFKAAWRALDGSLGYLYMLAFFAVGAYRWSQDAPWWIVVGHVGLGLFFAFLYQCPLSPFSPEKPKAPPYTGEIGGIPLNQTLIEPPTFEQGELDVLNKGYEPVETPYDPVGDIIASHDSSCEICTEWKRLREQSG